MGIVSSIIGEFTELAYISEEIQSIGSRASSLSLEATLETCHVAPQYVHYTAFNPEMFIQRSTG